MLKPFFRNDTGTAEISLTALKEKAKNEKKGFIVLAIDKKKAHEFLDTHKMNDDPLIRDTVYVLTSISYSVKRSKITDTLFEKGKFKGRSENIDSIISELVGKNTSINIAISIDRTSYCSGNLTFPGYEEWKKLLNLPSIQQAIKNNVLDKKLFESDPQIKKEVAELFKDSATYHRKHKRKRVYRNYALPLIAKPSGCFRLRRYDYQRQPVYQLLEATEGCYDLVPVVGNNLMVDQASIQKIYNKHTISPIGYFPEAISSVHFYSYRRIPFTDTFDLSKKGITELSIAPGSKNGMKFKIVINLNSFFEFFIDQFKPDDIYCIPSVIKILNEKEKGLFTPDLPLPRTSIHLDFIAHDKVYFQYNAQGHRSKLRELYATIGIPV